jgi:hypothetical protein
MIAAVITAFWEARKALSFGRSSKLSSQVTGYGPASSLVINASAATNLIFGDKQMKTKFKRLLQILTGLSYIFVLSGCENIAPIQPDASESVKRSTHELTFLQSKNTRLGKVFEVSQLITAAGGGSIEVGDDLSGFSSLAFGLGDVNEDLTVGFRWDSNRFEVEFSPHGSTFNNPVTVRLSYKDADLNGVDEERLGIWYFDEQEGMWELAGKRVNKQAKYVEGTTTHFSRYGIAID